MLKSGSGHERLAAHRDGAEGREGRFVLCSKSRDLGDALAGLLGITARRVERSSDALATAARAAGAGIMTLAHFLDALAERLVGALLGIGLGFLGAYVALRLWGAI